MKGVSSSMTIRGALLLIVGFALQLATMLGYITPDEAAVFNEKTAHLVGLGADIVGLGMVIVGRIRAGGLSLFGKTLGVMLLAVALGACATPDGKAPDAWYVSCSAYVRTLAALRGYNNAGKLSPVTVERVNQLVQVIAPICENPQPQTTNVLAALDAAVSELTLVKESIQ